MHHKLHRSIEHKAETCDWHFSAPIRTGQLDLCPVLAAFGSVKIATDDELLL